MAGPTFDERTKFAWPIVIVLLGGAAWLTNMSVQLSYAQKNLEDIKTLQDTYNRNQVQILREIARIQGKMGLTASDDDKR